MLEFLIDAVMQSYRAPRKAVRRVLDVVDGYEGVALLFGLAFSVNTFLVILVSLLAGRGGVGVSFVFSDLLFSVVAYSIAVALIYRVGRALGGKGSLREIATVVAWHSLVTVIFSPLVAVATLPNLSSGAAAGLALAQLAMVGVVLWLLANFIAEAHRFKSVLRVAGGLFGGVFLIGFVLSLLLPGLMTTA
ncbi:YIP1 family protein [Pikeienuella sp. HZG-20]|uniref:YIP1 family protein n=1 Tax=Paludibacillus litoralis TaxID=3133267 RepID=UPI0030EF00D3